MSESSTPLEGPPVERREQWTGQGVFILAAIGSAVGLGNIWRFPGVAYDNGAGAFLIPYLVALITTGIPFLFLDYAIGHRFRGGAPLAFRRLGGRGAEALGWFQVALCFVIGLYYTVVIAWALSYFVFSFDLRWGDDPTGFFLTEYLHVGEPGISLEFVPGVLIPLVVVWAATIAVLAAGIVKGIHRSNVIFMPLLLVAFLILVVRALFLPGAMDGLNAFFAPDWQALADPNVWIAAYGHIFFSLSIAFGIMITYASYRRRRANLTTPGLVVAFANSSFEVLAGVGVFATLGFFAFQQQVAVADLEGITGVALSFMTFPAIVAEMPAGEVFGILFFGSLTVAGFTSLLSVLQVVSAAFQDLRGWSPRRASVTIGSVSAVLSILLFSTTTGLLALDVTDEFVNNVGVVSSAILTTVLVVWVLRRGPELRAHLNAISTFEVGRVWVLLVGLVAPVVLGYMLVSRIIHVAVEGYGGMPTWYIVALGWGAVAFAVLAAIAMTLVPWRRNPDEFTPWPPVEPAAPGRSSREEVTR